MSKKSRGEHGEQIVNALLKDLCKDAKLIKDATYVFGKNEMSHQIDHIYIHPHGIFVIETKNYYGEINVDETFTNWSRTIKGKVERLANPLKQNRSHVEVIRHLLSKKYPVEGVILFVRDNAPYGGDINLINLKDLPLFIESFPYKKLLLKKEVEDIYQILMSHISDISKEEHIESIGYLKQVNKELKDEKIYAIERRICPRCGGIILQNKTTFVCKSCNFNFTLK